MNPKSLALLIIITACSSTTLYAIEQGTDATGASPSIPVTDPSGSTETPITAQKYGPTKRGETIAHVAQQVLTDAFINNEQMIWALYTANPKAFEKGKLNRLRSGVYLTVPTPKQARSVDTTIAHREIETRTTHPAPKTPAVKPTKSGELDTQIEEVKREQEETVKEQVFLKARLKEMEDKIQTLLRENAERDAKLRAQPTPPK